IVRAILVRKYGMSEKSEDYLKRVENTFTDDPIRLREPRYTKKRVFADAEKATTTPEIPLIVNTEHDIHHVKDRGYVESPVRISVILKELTKTGLFYEVKAQKFAESHITAVHDKDFVDYLRRVCKNMHQGKSTYPVVFPVRNHARPPKDMEIRAGYYCIDTFTPINHNAYLAARGAVNCALTAAEEIVGGKQFSYALVRPPGHHAERRAIGGFCYFNSAAIAAHYLSDYGSVAVLDIDYHHGNGTQNIFYDRDDVLTVSIHGHPNGAYPFFSGFEDETGSGKGAGYNLNLPLPPKITADRYHKTLQHALGHIKKFDPIYLVLSLGLDTAKNDPTGTWPLVMSDFVQNGRMIGALGMRTLIVQEGGYNNRNLGSNAKSFFNGLWQGFKSGC
ncbi:MAG: histone deacetylase family protein, partial [Gammaproteobacteria bacterium]|nr:histone deacetylase family protein [Gammaproteobacteria bacterium]